MILLTLGEACTAASATAAKKLTLTNCGADATCGNADDVIVEKIYVNETDTDKFALSEDGQKVWARLAAPMVAGTKYQLVVDAGAFLDAAGNSNTQGTSTFTVMTVQDAQAPTVFMVGAVEKDAWGLVTGTFPKVKAYFNEPVVSGAASKTWTLASGNRVVKAYFNEPVVSGAAS